MNAILARKTSWFDFLYEKTDVHQVISEFFNHDSVLTFASRRIKMEIFKVKFTLANCLSCITNQEMCSFKFILMSR